MISQGEGCREDVVGGGGGGRQKNRKWEGKSPTSKVYTTWARILSDRYVFCTKNGGVQCPWGFSCFPSFFGDHLPQTNT